MNTPHDPLFDHAFDHDEGGFSLLRPPAGAAPLPAVPEGPLDNHLPRLLMARARAEAEADPPEPRSQVPGSVALHLLRLAAHPAPLRVTLTEPDGVTTLLVGRGHVLSVERDPHPPALEDVRALLRREGLLPPGFVPAPGLSVEAALARVAPGPRVAAAAAGLRRTLLARALSARRLTLAVSDGVPALRAALPTPLEVHAALHAALFAAADSYSADDLAKGMRRYQQHFICRRDPPPFDPARLRLQGAEERFWAVSLEKPLSLVHLGRASALSPAKTWRALYALLFLGLLELRADFRPPDDELLAPTRAFLARLQDMDAFEIIEAHWTSLPEEIEANGRRVRGFWADRRAPAGVEAEFEAYRQEILARIDRALRFLSDEGRRRHYRERHHGRTQLHASAELCADQARMEAFRKDWEAATLLARRAVDLHPEHAEHRQLLARVKARQR